MARFFVNRPIVAIVISILMTVIGIVAMVQLPIAQFPNIAPPEIQLSATYVGADAVTLEQSVATPIEQQMQGVDNMIYMYSINASNGQTKLYVDFDVTTKPNDDQILSQMRYTQAESKLPQEVRNYGVTIKKSTTSPLALFSLYSPNGTYDNIWLTNYANININDPMARVPGIGQVSIFGAGEYAMRFWVRPDVLAKLNITVTGDPGRREEAEHRQPGGAGRRRAGAARPGIHLHRAGAGPVAHQGGVRGDRRAGEHRRIHRAAEGCRAGSNWVPSPTTRSAG